MISAAAALAAAFDRIDADGRDGIWITLADRRVAAERAQAIDQEVTRGTTMPLAGLTLAVKDNIDVAGLPTTAGCPAYAYMPAGDAPAVARLTAAGAVVVGKTNLDQFATGLVGVRSPYGICPNAHWPGLIAGGSSSGSAVAVAAGVVDLGLGTDTAGSGRVPAACNGIVGLKPTRGRISTSGVVPACRSLDCVSVFARSVADAATTARLASGFDADDPWSRARPLSTPRAPARRPRVGVPAAPSLAFEGDVGTAEEFTQAVDSMAATFDVIEVDIEPFLETGTLLYGGAYVAERYDAVGTFIDTHRDEVDPVVGAIITAAGSLPAWRVFADMTALARLRSRTACTWDLVDALLVPSVPRIPTVREVLAEPIEVNSMLGTYTNFVNLLDLCALTLPVGTGSADRPPASVTLIAPAWSDDLLVTLGSRLGTPSNYRTG